MSAPVRHMWENCISALQAVSCDAFFDAKTRTHTFAGKYPAMAFRMHKQCNT